MNKDYLIERTKEVEKVKKNGNLKSLKNTIESILKSLESSRR